VGRGSALEHLQGEESNFHDYRSLRIASTREAGHDAPGPRRRGGRARLSALPQQAATETLGIDKVVGADACRTGSCTSCSKCSEPAGCRRLQRDAASNSREDRHVAACRLLPETAPAISEILTFLAGRNLLEQSFRLALHQCVNHHEVLLPALLLATCVAHDLDHVAQIARHGQAVR
jgi:hypothetical protein